MKDWLESWQAVAALMVAVVSGTLWIANSISGLRLEIANVTSDLQGEIHALETRMEGRLSAVEAKLDVLINALDIQAGDEQ